MLPKMRHAAALALLLLPAALRAGEPIDPGEPLVFDFMETDVDMEWEEAAPEPHPLPPVLARECRGWGGELVTVYDDEEVDDEVGFACVYGNIRFYDLEGRELELWEPPLESAPSPFDFIGGMGFLRVGASMAGRAAQFSLRARAAAGYGTRILSAAALRAAGVQALAAMRRVYLRLTPRHPPFKGVSINGERRSHVRKNHVRHPNNPRMNRCRSLFDRSAFPGADDKAVVEQLFAQVRSLLSSQPSRWRRVLFKNGDTGFTRRVRFPGEVGFDIEKGNKPTRWVRVVAAADGRVATMFPDAPGLHDRRELRRRGCPRRAEN